MLLTRRGRSSDEEAAAIAAAVAALPAPVDPWPHMKTVLPNICPGAGVPGQNLTLFMRQPARANARTWTPTAKVFNGATINGNWAAGLWTSIDGGVTFTRLGGTPSTAQTGISQTQAVAFSGAVTVPAGAPLWISFSEDSATGQYLRVTGWTGTLVTDNQSRTAAAYNQTADIAAASLSAATNLVYVEIS